MGNRRPGVGVRAVPTEENGSILLPLTRIPSLLALAVGPGLAGCGYSPGDRAVSGGLLGAGGGARIGALAGNAGAGALIGGVVGAAGGALTSPNAVNLGRPVWR